jgi:hypothetical protein
MQIRCTYSAYDQADELTAAYSLAFSPTGEQYAFASPYSQAHEAPVQVQIQVNRSGTDAKEKRQKGKDKAGNIFFFRFICGFNKAIRVYATSRPGREVSVIPTYDKTFAGQRGIISCLAFNPDQSRGLQVAAGSFAGSVGLYSVADWGTIAILSAHKNGVTQVTTTRAHSTYSHKEREREKERESIDKRKGKLKNTIREVEKAHVC